jgi:hypothetical protein
MYKIIQNNKVIDVVRVPYFVNFLSSGHIAITDKSSAQGIIGSDMETVYSFAPVANQDITTVIIEEITLEEFNRLQSLLNSDQEICADESTLEMAKRDMIRRLSNICKNKITAGFSVKLSDNNFYNFKLTTEDQLNLMLIENQLAAGVETFLYHATDQPCRFFTRDDMTLIIRAFKQYVLYHTTYFNAAKHYIKSLVDIEKVKLFTYGTDISDTIDDKVLKQILKRGGNLNESASK